MKSNISHHGTLVIDTDLCIGCSHCMRACPTEALRVSGGKAMLHADWCVDCGKCYKVCPSTAIKIIDEDIDKILPYEKRILLVPSIFYAQFPAKITEDIVNAILSNCGFTDICIVEQSVDAIIKEVNKYIANSQEKPLLSCFCPGVVRLIQVRFPSLIDKIMLILPPLEVTATYYRKKYVDEGFDAENIGIFYITPCIAKTAAIKTPIGGYTSPINGPLNMDILYNKVMAAYKSKAYGECTANIHNHRSTKGASWATTGGESSLVDGYALAVDGLSNVIDFLERLENDEFDIKTDFIELRICDESCAGGILTQNNRFVAADTMRRQAKLMPSEHCMTDEFNKLSFSDFHINNVEPRYMVKYDKDIMKAIKKMEKANLLRKLLPGIDCGACGAPSCEALASDIARDDAILSNCIFMQAIYEKEGSLQVNEAIELMEKVWGNDRFINKEKKI